MKTLMNRRAGVATAALLCALAGTAFAQGNIDFTKVEIKTAKIANNFYALEGAGGAIGVLTGPDGVFMVDSQYAPLTDKIVAAIKQISDGRIRFMVNTHVHPDHTGGNENLGKLGVTILSRDQLRMRLAGGQRPAPPIALPTITYNETTTVHMNGEDIRLIPMFNAHTDGDTLVYFPNANVLMTGDFYRSVGYPFPDRNNGGSVKGLIDALQAVVDLAKPDTKIIPGHGEIVDKTAVAAHRAMAIVIRDRVAAMVKAGKTADEVVAAKPTADYDAKVPQGATTSERFLRAIHAELSAAK
ncbi:MAG: MBL fold metallo-hydrolase [Acidobacteriia bacterium]|nr:MBL fold metallo-hydrolase [Terriglobia bacterium]